LVSINVVALRRARLMVVWVTVCQRVNHVIYPLPRSTQPGHHSVDRCNNIATHRINDTILYGITRVVLEAAALRQIFDCLVIGFASPVLCLGLASVFTCLPRPWVGLELSASVSARNICLIIHLLASLAPDEPIFSRRRLFLLGHIVLDSVKVTMPTYARNCKWIA